MTPAARRFTAPVDFIGNAVEQHHRHHRTARHLRQRGHGAGARPAGRCRRSTLRHSPSATVVPREAVNIGPDGQFVYVVDSDGNAELRAGQGAVSTTAERSRFRASVQAGDTGDHRRPAARACRASRVAIATSRRNAAEAPRAMNISAPFIERPVMTTLVMAALVIFGAVRLCHPAGQRTAERRFPDHLGVSASLPGADPETMASAVATPLESQFSTIAGVDSMTSSSTQGSTSITIQFDLDRNIDGAAQDVQAAISAAARAIAPAHAARRRPSARSIRPTRRSCSWRCSLRHAAALRGGRICRDPAGAADFHARRRGPGQCLRLAEIRGAHPGRSRRAGRAPDRHRPGWRPAISAANVNIADRHAERPDAVDADPCQRPAQRTRPNSTARSSPTATARRCACRMSAARSTASRTTYVGELVQRQARHRARDPAPARLQHDRASSTRSTAILPHFQAAAAGVGAAGRDLRPQPDRSAPRSPTCRRRC